MKDQLTIFLFITILLFIKFANKLMGYDYGDYGFNITSLSLLDIGNCDLEEIEGCLRPTTTTLRLRQDTVQDGNLVDRTIHYCGMDSHVNSHCQYSTTEEESICKK